MTLLCRVLGLVRSGYYAWRQRCPSARAQPDQQLTTQIKTLFTDSRRTYASPRVHAELRAQGVRRARKRVARLMRRAQLCARARGRSVRTTTSRHTEPIAPNLLQRTFQVEAPSRVWVTEAARTAVQTHPYWKREFARLAKRIGEKAVVTIARKLLVVVWHVLMAKSADRRADAEQVAFKLMVWAWKLSDEQRGGLSSRQFIRTHLIRLG